MEEPIAKKMDKKEGNLVLNYMYRAKYLVRKKINSWNSKDEGPLYQAANKYNADDFNDALNRVLNEDAEESHSEVFTLLHVAVNHGNTDALRQIVSKFPSFLSKQNSKGDTVWHVAAAKTQYVEVFHELFNLQNGFIKHLKYSNNRSSKREVTWGDISLREINEEGNTALHVALINRHKSMAEQLVKQDWNLSYYVNNENKSALYLTAESGYLDTLKLMLQNESLKGGHENKIGDARTSYGGTVRESLKGKSLVHAAITGRHADVLDFLMEEDLVFRNEVNCNWAPLHWAASIGFLEGIRYLLQKYSVSATERDEIGLYPIHWASMNGHVDVIQELLQKAPCNLLTTPDNQNVLHVAAKNGQPEVVSYILKTPVLENLINMRDVSGNTPLHYATMHWQPRTVSVLTWDNRVELNSRNEDGFTPLDAAESNMKGLSSFQQWLTWQAIKVAGGTRGSSGKTIDAKRITTDHYTYRKKTFLLVSILVGVISLVLGLTLHGVYRNSDTDHETAISIQRNIKFHVSIFCATIAMSSSIVVAVSLIWAHINNGVFGALRLAIPLLGMAFTMMSLALLSGVVLVGSKLHGFADIILTMIMVFLVSFTTLFLPLCFPFPFGHRILRYITYYPIRLLIWLSHAS